MIAYSSVLKDTVQELYISSTNQTIRYATVRGLSTLLAVARQRSETEVTGVAAGSLAPRKFERSDEASAFLRHRRIHARFLYIGDTWANLDSLS